MICSKCGGFIPVNSDKVRDMGVVFFKTYVCSDCAKHNWFYTWTLESWGKIWNFLSH
jgi:hypothetical protein